MPTQVGYQQQTRSCPCHQKIKQEKQRKQPYLIESSTDRTQLDSSSSDSTTSEQFPVRLKLNIKSSEIHATPRSNRIVDIEFRPKCQHPKVVMEPLKLPPPPPIEDEYHSCYSDASDDEMCPKVVKSKTRMASKKKETNRDCEILQLLQQVIQLIKDDRKSSSSEITNVTPSKKIYYKKPFESSSSTNKCPKSSSEVCDTKDPLGVLRSMLNDLKEGMVSCGPCKNLRNLINSSSSKTEECISVSEEASTTPSKKSAAEMPTLSSSTIEDECTCMDEPEEQRQPDPKPEPTVVHPCPFFSYCMALMNAQGMTLPMFQPFPPSTIPIPPEIQKAQMQAQEEQFIETKVQKDEEESIHDEEEIQEQETDGEGSYMAEEIIVPSDVQESQLLDNNEYIGYDIFGPQIPSTEKEEAELRGATNEYVPDSVEMQTFDNNDFELETENRCDPTCPIDCRMTVEESNNDMDEEQPPDLALYHMERLGSLLGNDLCLEQEEEERPEYILDGFYEEYDDRSELAKEKFAECFKTKEPSDFQDSGKMTYIKKSDNDEGLKEFKFFVDSVILDLDAMEHARRKCDLIRNVCMPRSDCGSRESFPVTIVDVQDLGSTSLYVRWKVHDCFGIGGYEIFVDGYLTNRYYHCRHEASVITDVDVTIPHKIALVAQPTLKDDSLKMLCCPKKKSKSNGCLKDNLSSLYSSAISHWRPSIYLYDPSDNKSPPLSPLKG